MTRRVLHHGQLAVQLQGSGVARIREQEAEHGLQRRRRLQLSLRHPQLEAHQLQQLGRLVGARLELLTGFAQATVVDHSCDPAQLGRQGARVGAGRVCCGHTIILARHAAGAHSRAQSMAALSAGSLTCT